ncbi:MAG: NlpC/P60 family protein [Betaproteobacteria bacterium]|nr:MAG: NlpC/P60 family protein [Betaproteobacteria bacterium]
MRCNYLFFSILVLSGCGFAPARDPSSAPARSPEMVFQALAAAGVPYRRGGESPETGFDCSGLVAHVYREAFGIQLPHNARAQSRVGRRVSLDQLEAGDLVFYNTERRPYSHVGIYLGDDRFIHAPRPGAAVRVENMRTDYWVRRFDGARRISLSQ